MPQLAQPLLKPSYVHGQPWDPVLGALGKWSHLVHTLEPPGCKILQNKLIHRSHVCPVHLAQDWTPEAGGGSFLPAAKMAKER